MSEEFVRDLEETVHAARLGQPLDCSGLDEKLYEQLSQTLQQQGLSSDGFVGLLLTLERDCRITTVGRRRYIPKRELVHLIAERLPSSSDEGERAKNIIDYLQNIGIFKIYGREGDKSPLYGGGLAFKRIFAYVMSKKQGEETGAV